MGGVGGGGRRDVGGVEGRERRDTGGGEGRGAVGNDDRDGKGASVVLFVMTLSCITLSWQAYAYFMHRP